MSSMTKPAGGFYYGWYVVAACTFVALIVTGARNAFGIFVIPMTDEFGWSRGMISFAAALGFLVNGATQPFLGRLVDRTGGRSAILISLVVVGVSTILLSLTFHILFLIFMFGLVTSTAASGASITNTGAVLARWFQRKRATVVGLTAGGASAGGLILVPFSMYLLQASDSWRLTWVVLGAAVLVLGVPIAYLFLHESPAQRGLEPDGDASTPQTAGGGARTQPRGPLDTDSWTQSYRSLPIWQMSASYVVCGATTFLLSVHFVPFAIDQGISPTMAATIFGLMMGLNAIGAIGAGMLSDRFGRKNLLALVYCMRGCGYILLLVVPAFIPGSAAFWIFAVVAGFSWIASAPLTTSLTADVYGTRALGTIAGVSFVFHQAGGFVSVLVTGILYDFTGSYTIPFAIAGAMLFPAAISALTIKERRYSSRYVGAAGLQTSGAGAAGGD